MLWTRAHGAPDFFWQYNTAQLPCAAQRALRETLGEPQRTRVPLPQPPAAELDMAQVPEGFDLGSHRAAASPALQAAPETVYVPLPTRLPVRSRPVAAT